MPIKPYCLIIIALCLFWLSACASNLEQSAKYLENGDKVNAEKFLQKDYDSCKGTFAKRDNSLFFPLLEQVESHALLQQIYQDQIPELTTLAAKSELAAQLWIVAESWNDLSFLNTMLTRLIKELEDGDKKPEKLLAQANRYSLKLSNESLATGKNDKAREYLLLAYKTQIGLLQHDNLFFELLQKTEDHDLLQRVFLEQLPESPSLVFTPTLALKIWNLAEKIKNQQILDEFYQRLLNEIPNIKIQSIKSLDHESLDLIAKVTIHFSKAGNPSAKLTDFWMAVRDQAATLTKEVEGYSSSLVEEHDTLRTANLELANKKNAYTRDNHLETTKKKCGFCNGTAKIVCLQCRGKKTCNRCEGSGQLIHSACKGTGRITCKRCNGSGHLSAESQPWDTKQLESTSTQAWNPGQQDSSYDWNWDRDSSPTSGRSWDIKQHYVTNQGWDSKLEKDRDDERTDPLCPDCGGRGTVLCECQDGKVECNICNGSGNCDRCNGKGYQVCGFCQQGFVYSKELNVEGQIKEAEIKTLRRRVNSLNREIDFLQQRDNKSRAQLVALTEALQTVFH